MLPIVEIARVMGLDDKLVMVTGMTPTPAGVPSASRSSDSASEEICSCNCAFCPCASPSHESLSGF